MPKCRVFAVLVLCCFVLRVRRWLSGCSPKAVFGLFVSSDLQSDACFMRICNPQINLYQNDIKQAFAARIINSRTVFVVLGIADSFLSHWVCVNIIKFLHVKFM